MKPQPRTLTTSRSNGGILLALDTDEAGVKATIDNGTMLSDLFRWWGIIRYPKEPTSHALAIAQRCCDDLAQEIQAREAAGLPTDQTEVLRSLIWDYMMGLYRERMPTVFSRAETPEELNAAIVIEDNPILPEHGRIDYEVIKAKVDIVDYIGRHVELKPRGNKYMSECPLPDHEDSTPSFWVYPETRSWYCFGCRRGGDVIEYAKLRGIDLGQR